MLLGGDGDWLRVNMEEDLRYVWVDVFVGVASKLSEETSVGGVAGGVSGGDSGDKGLWYKEVLSSMFTTSPEDDAGPVI